MKTVLCFVGIIALALASSIPSPARHYYETKPAYDEFLNVQKKVLGLLHYVNQVDTAAEYYQVGKSYDIKANLEQYKNNKAVKEFFNYYENGYLPKGLIFSVFYDKMRHEAIALFNLLINAKEFDTFYNIAAWARVHLNEGLFTYAFSIAVVHREDTEGIILPAPYEIYPYFFVNSEVIEKMYRIKMQNGLVDPSVGHYYGITKEGDQYSIYANYSGRYSWTLGNEQLLSYFTEDIGLNAYYYNFHTIFPFWMQGDEHGPLIARRGEIFSYFHQQLLARYYMERLTNGLAEIPEFSWRWPVKTGYYPNMLYRTGVPFPQRSNYYYVQNPENAVDLEYVESYESQFLKYLHEGQYHTYEYKEDLRKNSSINIVGSYWQSNLDSTAKSQGYVHQKYYEVIARMLLGGSPDEVDDYYVWPSALEQFQTSLRDPVFWQLYKHINNYFIQYKQYLQPYNREQLSFNGVKINSVSVDKLVTYFEYYDFDATNGLYYSKEESKDLPYFINIRQPRLNHKDFSVNIDVKSGAATDAVFKIFLAPLYDGAGNVIKLENNWMNFVELDRFVRKLNPGINTIVRNSTEFFFFSEDAVPIRELYKMIDSKKVPKSMPEMFVAMPNRMMLPKGSYGGYPFQLFVYVYSYQPIVDDLKDINAYLIHNRPLGYPFDLPIDVNHFNQPNMYTQQVMIYHESDYYPYQLNTPSRIFGLHT